MAMQKYKLISRFIFLLGSVLLVFQLSMATVSADANTSQLLQNIGNDNIFYNSNSPGPTCSSSSSGPVTPGNGSPDGSTFPDLDPTNMANAIDAWIKQVNPNGELNGLGSTIVADGKHANINPFLLVSIARNESLFDDPSVAFVQKGNNGFGREAVESQPHFEAGGTLWYKWTSVEASVDYTAPENQGVIGGDMADYIRNEYSSSIDNNNLIATLEAYAPPSQNNTAEYIANVKTWISQLVSLADGSNSQIDNQSNDSSSTCVGNDCNSTPSGSAAISQLRQNIVCIANQQLAIWESQPGYPWTGENSYSETGYLNYSQHNVEYWCADFVSWVYNQADYPLQPDPNWRIGYIPTLVSVLSTSSNFQEHPAGSNYVPQPGDIAVHAGSGGPESHVNIVISIDGSTVNMIGGDAGHGPFPGGSIVAIETSVGGYWNDGVDMYISPED